MTFRPTHIGDVMMTTACCYLCGRRATGIGMGRPSRGEDPKWLCEDCIMLGKALTAVRRFEVYEDRAIATVIENVGPIVEGNGSDLAEWTEEQVDAFVRAIVTGFGAAVREEVKKGEAPF